MSDGYSKGKYGNTPSTSELNDAGFMRDYNAARHDFAPPPPLPSPQPIFHVNHAAERRVTEQAPPSEPLTLRSAVRGLAGTCFVIALGYVFLMPHPTFANLAVYGLGGAAAGAAAGVCLWLAVKILQLAVWLLVKALQIGLVLGVAYFVVRALGS